MNSVRVMRTRAACRMLKASRRASVADPASIWIASPIPSHSRPPIAGGPSSGIGAAPLRSSRSTSGVSRPAACESGRQQARSVQRRRDGTGVEGEHQRRRRRSRAPGGDPQGQVDSQLDVVVRGGASTSSAVPAAAHRFSSALNPSSRPPVRRRRPRPGAGGARAEPNAAGSLRSTPSSHSSRIRGRQRDRRRDQLHRPAQPLQGARALRRDRRSDRDHFGSRLLRHARAGFAVQFAAHRVSSRQGGVQRDLDAGPGVSPPIRCGPIARAFGWSGARSGTGRATSPTGGCATRLARHALAPTAPSRVGRRARRAPGRRGSPATGSSVSETRIGVADALCEQRADADAPT